MGWNYDKPVLEYLERRVRYYKRELRKVKKFEKDKDLIKAHGRAVVKQAVKNKVDHYLSRISEYEKAIDKIKTN